MMMAFAIALITIKPFLTTIRLAAAFGKHAGIEKLPGKYRRW